MASVIQVPNETTSTSTRITREGKKITYRLNVIQQPERARACGSGAKSSADRRPVDPPPIVELRVFEGDQMQDITFPYSANFFLFATLENARTMAQTRFPTPNTFPVLTGTPVAGMAYLDRPSPAGYFIFPDLSVRHEGKYRLSFALYEELKEQKDMDADASQAVQVQASGIDAHVTHRLEVKSMPFTVFSAKKFPGLSESTSLSRMVAEQGCRVRIRRDVRMRRRDGTKGGKDWDEYEDETARDRERSSTPHDTYHTPQALIEPARPASAASNTSFGAPQRRTSMQDMNQSYQQGYPQPMGPPQPQQGGYQPPTQYSNPPPQQYQSQYPPSQQQHHQNMMQPPQTPYQQASAPPTYQPPPQPQPQQQSMQPMQQPYGYMQNQGYTQAGYEQHPHARHESMEYPVSGAEYRRSSIHGNQNSSYPPPNNMIPSYGHVDSSGRQTPVHQSSQMSSMPPPMQPSLQSSSSGPHMNGQALAPLKTEKMEPASPQYQLGAMTTSPNEMSYGGANKYAPQTPHAGSKRTYSDTFDTKHLNQPLRQGARPSVVTEDLSAGGYDDNSDDLEIMDARKMSYRRADGSQRSRRVPFPLD